MFEMASKMYDETHWEKTDENEKKKSIANFFLRTMLALFGIDKQINARNINAHFTFDKLNSKAFCHTIKLNGITKVTVQPNEC